MCKGRGENYRIPGQSNKDDQREKAQHVIIQVSILSKRLPSKIKRNCFCYYRKVLLNYDIRGRK